MSQNESRKWQVRNDSQTPEITNDDSGMTYLKHQKQN